MFVESYTFGDTAGLFPRLTSATVLAGSALLLVRDFLPGPLYSFVAESSELISTPDEAEMYEETDDPPSSDRAVDRPVRPSVFTGAIIVLYALASFLFGMLWMSPLFVVIYSRWFRQRWYTTVGLAVLAYGLAYGFMSVLNLELAEGYLLNMGGVM
ncbi:tripartite tricarboxylate transporter TctB family protein [Halorussus halophilus]|uniref:tripartite tricarboxylate transporter TctB family protein n=1 Tax=Halorussus halophilus TaxID=2650975 RepID=UPI0017882CFC|nr:tripartite tricarboxylate transporter TctB family protein [Halorussus halophilus]